MTIQDARYQIYLGFCGYPTQKFVLSFCGDFVDCFDTIQQAEVAAVLHAENRGHNHTGWVLLAKVGSVLWLRNTKGNKHRIAYNADVKEFEESELAAQDFGYCVLHEIQCEGKLS